MSALTPSEARDYDNLGEQAHIPILHDALRPLLGDLRGRSLLDFGCGDGRLTCRLAEHGVERVLGIDESSELLDTARRQAEHLPPDLAARIAFQRGSENALPTADRFDLALCSLMLMMCDRRERLDRTVRGLLDSLTPDGRACLVLTHPCFRRAVHAKFHNRLPEDFDYWQSGTPYRVVLDPDERQVESTFHDYHWTLTDYADAVGKAGGTIRNMTETPGQYDTRHRPVGQPAYLTLIVTR